MKPFFVVTQVRWSDLDANRHLANAAYMNFTSYCRMSFLEKMGITMKHLAKWNVGPAVLREEFSFFKEGYSSEEILVTVEITGMSENGEIFEFTHNLYKKATGVHMASSRVIGVWFSMSERKKTPPPPEMLALMLPELNPETVKTLSLQDLKNLPDKRQDQDLSEWLS